jgi:mRNA interferase MazF
VNPAIGWVLRVNLAQRIPPGHEQEGLRPVVVVGLPSLAGQPRYPVFVVVPLTTNRAQGWVRNSPNLYPRIPSGAGGLPKDSVVLLDQVQIIDASRVALKLGELSKTEMVQISRGLKKIMGFHPSGKE